MTLKTIAATLICCLCITSASYGVTIYQDFDPGAEPGDPRPNSNAAAAAFDAAAGALGIAKLIDFETGPTGYIPVSYQVAPGVLMQLFAVSTTSSGVTNQTGNAILGYNTTVPGSRHLRLNPVGSNAGVLFTFLEPINSFGAYITGLGTANGNLTAQFNDGSPVVLPIVGEDDGGVQFFGFTNVAAPISSVFLRFQGSASDVLGVDDVRFVTVPEPSTWLLTGLGIACLSAFRLRRK